ncbi:MAG: chloride channel protein [Bacteroidia bacterium]
MDFIKAIKKTLKSKFDLIDNEKLKLNLLNALPYWIAALISGALAVLYAKLFSLAESGTQFIYTRAGWSLYIISPVSFILAWWLVSKYSPFARGSGIPQVTAAIELSNPKHNYKVNSLLSLRVIFVKIFSSLIMVFGGGVVGREGPTIQISGSIFKKINDLLPAWYPKISKRNMIVTGAAAGLAAAFNTPLGGIVFAIEELTKTHFSFFKSALLTGVIIAGITALNILGPYLYLGYPQLSGVSLWVILAIIPVIFATGIAGSGTGKIILYIIRKKLFLKKNYQKALYAGLCGLAIALLGVLISSKIFGSGKDLMVSSLFSDQKRMDWYIPLLRMAGSVISFTAGTAGGIFAPSLSAGAAIGAVISGWFHLSNADTNLIILCGMTGFLTSITRSPFTSSILVSEMTNSHNVIFYIMMTALLSNLLASVVSKRSFYDYLKDQYIHEIHQTETQSADPVALTANSAAQSEDSE